MPLTRFRFNEHSQHIFRISARLGLILAGVGIISCTTQPVVEAPPVAAPVVTVTKVEDKPFETETLYALLVAEFAGNRQRYDVMLNNYVQQATHTRDTEVTARASRLARYLNAHNEALAMSLLWSELEPDNLEAHLNATVELTDANQLMAAMKHAKILLEQGQGVTGLDAIAARAQQINDSGLTAALQQQYQQLARENQQHVPLLIGLSLLKQTLEEFDESLRLAVLAQTVNPDSFQAAAQETRVLQQMGRKDDALKKLGAMVEQFPNNDRLRLQYARSLIKINVKEAETQFLALMASSPQDEDIILTVALIQYELKKYPQAKSHFLLLTENTNRKSTAHAYLGRIAAMEENNVTALRHLKQVEPGTEYLPALLKLSDIYLAQNEASTALEYIETQRSNKALSQDLKEGLLLLQTQVLNKTGKTQNAIRLLKAALDRNPKSVQVLYARAMLYTQEDQISSAEEDLKTVLSITPDNAAVLNALGYTLADKTNRLDEAYRYISQAYKLTPDDPAVIDSMGWIEYRRGNYNVALEKLNRAMQLLPDHEIAAHLGEVLWVTGNQQEALRVWRQGLDSNPESKLIHATVKRLNAPLPGPSRSQSAR